MNGIPQSPTGAGVTGAGRTTPPLGGAGAATPSQVVAQLPGDKPGKLSDVVSVPPTSPFDLSSRTGEAQGAAETSARLNEVGRQSVSGGNASD